MILFCGNCVQLLSPVGPYDLSETTYLGSHISELKRRTSNFPVLQFVCGMIKSCCRRWLWYWVWRMTLWYSLMITRIMFHYCHRLCRLTKYHLGLFTHLCQEHHLHHHFCIIRHHLQLSVIIRQSSCTPTVLGLCASWVTLTHKP